MREISFGWALQLREALTQSLQQLGGAEWGLNEQENAGFVIDLISLADMSGYDAIGIERQSVHEGEIVIHARVGPDITSLPEIRRAVCKLLCAEGEELFILLPFIDQKTVRYWFAIGDRGHGHIGQIIIRREDIPQVEFADAEEIWAGGED